MDIASLAAEVRALSPAEVIAVVAAVAYLRFAIREIIWCWPCACLSTAIYIVLFADARLYMEAVLNLFYFAMAIYGWHQWLHGGPASGPLQVSRWPLRVHLLAIVALLVLAAGNGWLLARYTDAAFPYLDSLTTWSAIWATFLLARKVLENWWYWLAIDSVSVVLYWQRDLELTAALFVAYLLMIPFGMKNWRRSMMAAAA